MNGNYRELIPPILFSFFQVFLFLFSPFIWAESHHPQEFLQKISGSKDEGQQIIQHFCINCHATKPLINLGAPRIGESAEWIPRVSLGKNVLFKHTDEGLNAMPPRGGCFECTDKQLWLAILEMLPEQERLQLVNEDPIHP